MDIEHQFQPKWASSAIGRTLMQW